MALRTVLFVFLNFFSAFLATFINNSILINLCQIKPELDFYYFNCIILFECESP